MEKMIEKYNVSRETFFKLKRYESLLKEWQAKFNLVSNNSLADAWNRHFLDSLQLFKYIPTKAKKMYDFGSGAGFPGMVIAIVANEKLPNLEINLVESIKKKTLYLNTVQKELSVNVNIINDRIENLPKTHADVITSRAMCNLKNLLSYAYPLTTRNTIMIFPKGKTYRQEIDEACKVWNFDYRAEANEICSDGVILIISNLFKKELKNAKNNSSCKS